MVKKVICIASAAVLSFYAESMYIGKISAVESMHIVQTSESFLNLKLSETKVPNVIKTEVLDEEKDAVAVQLRMLTEIFGAYKDAGTAGTRRIIIDISFENLDKYADRLLSQAAEADKETDGWKKINNMRKDDFDYSGFADLCCDELFDYSSLSPDSAGKFVGIISELAAHPIGRERLKTLLYVEWLADITGSVFCRNDGKIIIIEVRKPDSQGAVRVGKTEANSGCQRIITFDFNRSYSGAFFINDFNGGEIELKSILLRGTLLHELSHLYHCKLFDLSLNACTAAIFNDETLKQYMLPMHSKVIFDKICEKFAGLGLEKIIKDGAKEVLLGYKAKIQEKAPVSEKHLPISDLLNGIKAANILSDINIAKIIVAKILSPKGDPSCNPWYNRADEMLTISGMTPIDIDDQKFLIIDRQNENSMYTPSGFYRLFHFDRQSLFRDESLNEILAVLPGKPLLSAMLQQMVEDMNNGKAGKMFFNNTMLNIQDVVAEYFLRIFSDSIIDFGSPYGQRTIYQVPVRIRANDVLYNRTIETLDVFGSSLVPQTFFNYAYENCDTVKMLHSDWTTFLSLAIKAGMPKAFIEKIISSVPIEDRARYIVQTNNNNASAITWVIIFGNVELFNVLYPFYLDGFSKAYQWDLKDS